MLQVCLELRFYARADERWARVAIPDDPRRVHARVSVDRRGAEADERGRALPSDGPVHQSGDAGKHSERPRSGIHGEGGARLAGAAGGEDAFYRAGESVGERVHRVVQREIQGRVSGPGDSRHGSGGEGLDSAVEAVLQRGASAQRLGLPATGS